VRDTVGKRRHGSVGDRVNCGQGPADSVLGDVGDQFEHCEIVE
jgi:hypothetical protein